MDSKRFEVGSPSAWAAEGSGEREMPGAGSKGRARPHPKLEEGELRQLKEQVDLMSARGS